MSGGFMSKIDDLMRQGLQLHQAGKLAEADALYAKVLDKQPSHGAANHLSGLVLLQRGDAAAAVVRLQRAVHVRGNDPEYLGNLGTALNSAGKPAEALAAFDKAIKLDPRNAGVLNNRGMALKALGRHREATESYEAAIEVAPGQAGFYRNLGNVLSDQAEWHAAIAAYRRALDLRPNFPNVVTGLCLALEATGRKEEAIATAGAFTQRFPTESEYCRALGHAHWLSGNPEAAAAAYRAAIAVDPADIEAHRILGLIVPRTSADSEVAIVAQLLERLDLKDDHRAQLEFTLGQAYDDIGDFPRSFAHFSRGNALVRKARPFDIDAARAEIEALQEAYSQLPDSDVPPLADPTGPVFIVGLPRSGKSTLEGMLARNPAFFPAGELQTLGNVAQELKNGGGHGAGPFVPSARERLDLARRYLDVTGRLAPGLRVLDTMPNNFLLVGAIRLALPTARVIACHRAPHPHAIALFQKYFTQTGNDYTSDLTDMMAFMDLYQTLTSFWNQRFPGFVRLADTTGLGEIGSLELPEICDIAGVPLHPASTTPFRSEPRLAPPPASPKARQAFYRGVLAERGRAQNGPN
jgi:tetratricopeptide (TPR) repeat protein